MTKNLTKVQGCYSKELREATRDIKFCLHNNLVSVNDMKNYVEAVIEPAHIDAEAKKRFRTNLQKCETKQEIDQLCYDAVVHGMYYHPHKRTN
jgi:hypothetical protein